MNWNVQVLANSCFSTSGSCMFPAARPGLEAAGKTAISCSCFHQPIIVQATSFAGTLVRLKLCVCDSCFSWSAAWWYYWRHWGHAVCGGFSTVSVSSWPREFLQHPCQPCAPGEASQQKQLHENGHVRREEERGGGDNFASVLGETYWILYGRRELNWCFYIQPSSTGEQKTKPTQNSVRELRGLGLSPDLVGRSAVCTRPSHTSHVLTCSFVFTLLRLCVVVKSPSSGRWRARFQTSAMSSLNR